MPYCDFEANNITIRNRENATDEPYQEKISKQEAEKLLRQDLQCFSQRH